MEIEFPANRFLGRLGWFASFVDVVVVVVVVVVPIVGSVASFVVCVGHGELESFWWFDVVVC